MKMLGRDDHGFVDISAMALNAAISGSILADPEACLVTRMALPFGSTRPLAPGHRRLITMLQRPIGDQHCGFRSLG